MRADCCFNPRQQGLTMVELMVAMTLGLLLTAAVLQTFVSAKRTYEYQQELSRIQENGRFAMGFLTRAIRQADFWGCLKPNLLVNTLSLVNFGGGINPFAGFDASNGVASYIPPAGPLPDFLVVRGGTQGGMPITGTPGSGANASTTLLVPGFEHQSGITIEDGDILLVSDCEKATIFQVTDKNTVGANKSLGHQANVPGITPGNTQGTGAGGGFGPDFKYVDDATLFEFGNTKFWVREGKDGNGNGRGVPVLVRGDDLDTDLGNDGVELVEGIENLQLLLGYDSDNDGAVEFYAPPTGVASDMDNVIAVQVSLVSRSLRNNIVDGTNLLAYNGTSYALPSSDRFLRKVFSSNITLRNRLD